MTTETPNLQEIDAIAMQYGGHSDTAIMVCRDLLPKLAAAEQQLEAKVAELKLVRYHHKVELVAANLLLKQAGNDRTVGTVSAVVEEMAKQLAAAEQQTAVAVRLLMRALTAGMQAHRGEAEWKEFDAIQSKFHATFPQYFPPEKDNGSN